METALVQKTVMAISPSLSSSPLTAHVPSASMRISEAIGAAETRAQLPGPKEVKRMKTKLTPAELEAGLAQFYGTQHLLAPHGPDSS